jgi:hypothetical protein
VTYDRKVKKDAFFWYKANWTTEPVVYITSKRFSPRTEALTPVKVYSNCDKVALYLNESLVSEKVPEEAIVSWPDITLKPGLNIIKTIGQKAGKQDCLDYACWTYLSPDSIKASSNQAGNEAPGAFDKNTQTRWSATSSAYPQWWRIDLGGLKNIKGVAIDWYYSQLRAYQYKLETSQNDITYQIVADKTTNQQTGNTQDLFEKQARYVRITVAGCSLANAWSAINEITFIGLSEIIPNLAPQVWAGDDQIRLLTTTIKLLGQVQDDDLPAGQALNIQWSLQSGPGQVTFTNPKALETQTTFSRPGVFEFKLTISDGEFTSTDLVKIDIRDNAWPIAPYARINFQPSTLSIPPDYLPDYGQTFGPKNGYVYGWNMDHTSLVRQRGINPDPRLDTICHFLSGGAWEFRLPIGLYNVTVSVGDAAFAKTYTINVEGVNYWQSVSLSANQFLQMSKNITVNDGILTVDAGLSAEKSTRLNYIEIAVVLNDNKPPAVEAGPDETITLPVDTITLEGQVTDDGKPLGSPLQISWVKESGPGVVTFGDPYSAQTTAIFAACGTYVLKLSASDGDTSAADTLTVNVMGQQLVEPLKINFQSPGSDVPADYLPDYGEIYGLKSAFNHFYGWNYDCSSLTRDRNKNMDQRLDTFTHFHAGGFWEIQVPNGDYHVTVSIGDAAYSSVCTINVEGSNYWSAVPLVANQFLQLVKTVKVTDGRLTVDCGQSPAMQTKINYAEIAPLN